MKALIIGKDIELVDSVDSTNEYAKQTLRTFIDGQGYWIFTERQTKGKGQSGSLWISDSANSFTGSFVVQPQPWPGREQDWAVRAQRIFSVSVQQSLMEFLKINIRLKWPNDIYFEGKKAGGMLIEVGWQQGKPLWTVAGLGLNLNHCAEFPAFSGHLNTNTSPLNFLKEWGGMFKACWDEYRFWADEQLLQNYENGLWGFGERRWFEESLTGFAFEGEAMGVDDRNRLLIRRIKQGESDIGCFDIKEIKWL